MKNKIRHPGELLQEQLDACGMSRKELAIRTGVTEKHICTIINGDRGISTAFARKLGYVFGEPDFWRRKQAEYDDEQVRIQEQNAISTEEIALLKPLHDIVSYFIQRGYMQNNCGEASKIIQLRKILKISDLTMIPKITYNAVYRAQLSSNVRVDPYVLFAWQSLCEMETKDIEVESVVNKELLKEHLGDIKKAMFESLEDSIHILQNIFAKCGIAFQVVKNFRGAPVQGFIKEMPDKHLILCLTFRGKRADTFWFTLFHEIGHILNGDYSTRFVDFVSVPGKMEMKADGFATDTLIDSEKYRYYIRSPNFTSWSCIEKFAKSLQIQPYMVLGRLQKDDYLDWSDYADKIPHYDWP